MNSNLIGRRSFLKRLGAALAALGATLSGLSLRRALGQQGPGYCIEAHDRILEEFTAFDPKRVFEVPVCLYPVSKNMNGEIGAEPVDQPKCEDTRLGGECVTLQTIDTVKMTVKANESCDSEVSIKFLDGDFTATLAVTYIENGDQRGYHTGIFEWRGQGGLVRGRMSGVTNAGTHRDPLQDCESCDAHGHMEGRLDGVVAEGDLEGCCVFASYAMSFDATGEGARGAIQATLEGVIMCECKPQGVDGLPPPTLLEPPCGSEFSHFPRTTTLSWSPVSGAASYTVEIDCFHCCAQNQWCTDVGSTWQIVPGLTTTSYTFDFVGAQPGRWRVWAVDAAGTEGQKTDWCEFSYTV